ncbi:MAG: hypothetical protein ACK2U9_19980 [Anaerolineae bacterium]
MMAAEALRRRNTQPSLNEICWEMSGDLCHSGAYAHIFNAVAEAAKAQEA